MANGAHARIDVAELQQLLETVEPGVILVPPRLLRRVIKRHCKLPGFGLQVPHRKTYVIERDALFRLVDETDLQLPPERRLPPTVVLLGEPDPERLARQTREEVLVKYWRLLLHARVHIVLDRHAKEGRLDEITVRERIHRIGETEFDEIRGVLKQEDFLLPPKDDRQAYVEFVALFLDLRHFAPTLLLRYFPALRDRPDVQEILAQDVDIDALLRETRPQGAPEPAAIPTSVTAAAARQPELENHSALNHRPSPGAYRRLLEKADRTRARGNSVRAAILRRQAASVADEALAHATLMSAHAELMRLAQRLRTALALNEEDAAEWQRALPPVLEHASRGVWPIEARLLYDLQKVCTEHERETYALDVVGWIVSA
ncbi:MAG TPA: hypothetical protein VGY58_12065, partial [Gemmataceae bacterium]|nr:hypothetical protein [Gemmataceae bacterium]